MLGFTVPHEFLIQHGSIACASCCSFCLVAWFTQRKGNETKVCITSDVCMSVRTARSGRESSARMPANARASNWISVPIRTSCYLLILFLEKKLSSNPLVTLWTSKWQRSSALFFSSNLINTLIDLSTLA